MPRRTKTNLSVPPRLEGTQYSMYITVASLGVESISRLIAGLIPMLRDKPKTTTTGVGKGIYHCPFIGVNACTMTGSFFSTKLSRVSQDASKGNACQQGHGVVDCTATSNSAAAGFVSNFVKVSVSHHLCVKYIQPRKPTRKRLHISYSQRSLQDYR